MYNSGRTSAFILTFPICLYTYIGDFAWLWISLSRRRSRSSTCCPIPKRQNSMQVVSHGTGEIALRCRLVSRFLSTIYTYDSLKKKARWNIRKLHIFYLAFSLYVPYMCMCKQQRRDGRMVKGIFRLFLTNFPLSLSCILSHRPPFLPLCRLVAFLPWSCFWHIIFDTQ